MMGSWAPVGSDIIGAEVLRRDGFTVSYSEDGHVIAVGSPYSADDHVSYGEVRVYAWDGSVWSQRGDTFIGGRKGNGSGKSIALSGDGTVLAYGVPFGDDTNSAASGWVNIKKWNGSVWEDRGVLSGDSATELFGWSVALSTDGATLAIGAPLRHTNGVKGGCVRVYSWTRDTIWTQKGRSIDGNAGIQLGYSVALSGDGNTIAVSAPFASFHASNGGAIYVNKWTGVSWSLLENSVDGGPELLMPDYISGVSGEQLGYTLALSKQGDTLVVGCIGTNAYVYRYTYATKFTKMSTLAGGSSVAVSSDGNIIAIGEPNAIVDDTINAGQANVYRWSGSAWVHRGETIKGTAANQYTGTSIGLSGNGCVVAVGIPYSNDMGAAVRVLYYKPEPPTSVSAYTQNISGQLVVQWQHPADSDSTQIKGYQITSNPDGLMQTVGYQNSAIMRGLTDLTAYTFTVVALNEYGTGIASSPSAEVIVTDSLPNAPLNVVAIAGVNEASLTWDVSGEGDTPIIGFEVISSPASSSMLVDVDDPLPITILGLTPYVKYTFYVTAINDMGASAAGISNPVLILS